jgi:putative two-component system response regulator
MRALSQSGVQSLIVLPLIMKDETHGFLLFTSDKGSAFISSHISFLESIGGQISFSIERAELIEKIEQHTKNLEHTIDIRTKEILKTQKTTIFALSKIAETRDRTTGDHLERIRSYCVLLAQILKYTGAEEITNQYIRDLYDSSILHDIGKVGIPDTILLKSESLTEQEIEIMERHTTIGFEALKSASQNLGRDSFLNMALDITQFHHERWDGSGYTKGLKGLEIPLSARIVAIADVYDALTTKRPYKQAYSHEESLAIMNEESHKFDPQLFKIFMDNANEFNLIRMRIKPE